MPTKKTTTKKKTSTKKVEEKETKKKISSKETKKVEEKKVTTTKKGTPKKTTTKKTTPKKTTTKKTTPKKTTSTKKTTTKKVTPSTKKSPSTKSTVQSNVKSTPRKRTHTKKEPIKEIEEVKIEQQVEQPVLEPTPSKPVEEQPVPVLESSKQVEEKPKHTIRNIIIILLIIIVLLSIIGTVIGIKYYNSKKLEYELDQDIEVLIFDEVYNTDYIHDIKNGELLTEKELVDTSKLGEVEIEYTIKNYFDKEKTISTTIKVIDNIPPEIENKEKLTTTEGKEIDLLKDVKVTDNSKEEIKASIEGEYDFKVPKEYELKYVAKDSSGNETKKDFKLVVNKKVVYTTTTNNNNKSSSRTTTGNGLVFQTAGTDSSWNGKTTSKGYTITVQNGIAYINGILIANKTFSLPSTYNPGMNSNVTAKANEMFSAAAAAGYSIWNQSGFRSYDTQKALYTGYVNRSGKAQADTYSARPGNSEHQSGLAFDVCAKGKPCINSGFDNTPEAKWLSDNCYKYGFILRYPAGKSGETGYKYESWHFRYVGVDLATKLYNGGNWITLESYFGITSTYNY